MRQLMLYRSSDVMIIFLIFSFGFYIYDGYTLGCVPHITPLLEDVIPLRTCAVFRDHRSYHFLLTLNTVMVVICIICYSTMEIFLRSYRIQRVCLAGFFLLHSLFITITDYARGSDKRFGLLVGAVDTLIMYMITGFRVDVIFLLGFFGAATQAAWSIFWGESYSRTALNVVLSLTFHICGGLLYYKTYTLGLDTLYSELYSFQIMRLFPGIANVERQVVDELMLPAPNAKFNRFKQYLQHRGCPDESRTDKTSCHSRVPPNTGRDVMCQNTEALSFSSTTVVYPVLPRCRNWCKDKTLTSNGVHHSHDCAVARRGHDRHYTYPNAAKRFQSVINRNETAEDAVSGLGFRDKEFQKPFHGTLTSRNSDVWRKDSSVPNLSLSCDEDSRPEFLRSGSFAVQFAQDATARFYSERQDKKRRVHFSSRWSFGHLELPGYKSLGSGFLSSHDDVEWGYHDKTKPSFETPAGGRLSKTSSCWSVFVHYVSCKLIKKCSLLRPQRFESTDRVVGFTNNVPHSAFASSDNCCGTENHIEKLRETFLKELAFQHHRATLTEMRAYRSLGILGTPMANRLWRNILTSFTPFLSRESVLFDMRMCPKYGLYGYLPFQRCIDPAVQRQSNVSFHESCVSELHDEALRSCGKMSSSTPLELPRSRYKRRSPRRSTAVLCGKATRQTSCNHHNLRLEPRHYGEQECAGQKPAAYEETQEPKQSTSSSDKCVQGKTSSDSHVLFPATADSVDHLSTALLKTCPVVSSKRSVMFENGFHYDVSPLAGEQKLEQQTANSVTDQGIKACVFHPEISRLFGHQNGVTGFDTLKALSITRRGGRCNHNVLQRGLHSLPVKRQDILDALCTPPKASDGLLNLSPSRCAHHTNARRRRQKLPSRRSTVTSFDDYCWWPDARSESLPSGGPLPDDGQLNPQHTLQESLKRSPFCSFLDRSCTTKKTLFTTTGLNQTSAKPTACCHLNVFVSRCTVGRRDTRLDAVRCFMSILLVVAMRRELENAAPSGVHGVRRVGALHPQNVPHRETSCVSSWDVLSSSESSCDSSIFDIVYSKARKVCRIDQSFQPLSLHYFHASFSEEFLLVFSAKNSKPLAESASRNFSDVTFRDCSASPNRRSTIVYDAIVPCLLNFWHYVLDVLWILLRHLGLHSLLHFLSCANFVMDLVCWNGKPVMPRQNSFSQTFVNPKYEQWFREWECGLTWHARNTRTIIQLIGTFLNVLFVSVSCFSIACRGASQNDVGQTIVEWFHGPTDKAMSNVDATFLPAPASADTAAPLLHMGKMCVIFTVVELVVIFSQLFDYKIKNYSLSRLLSTFLSVERLAFSVFNLSLHSKSTRSDVEVYGQIVLNAVLGPLWQTFSIMTHHLLFFLLALSSNIVLLFSIGNEETVQAPWNGQCLRMNVTFLHLWIILYLFYIRTSEECRRRVFCLACLPYLVELSGCLETKTQDIVREQSLDHTRQHPAAELRFDEKTADVFSHFDSALSNNLVDTEKATDFGNLLSSGLNSAETIYNAPARSSSDDKVIGPSQAIGLAYSAAASDDYIKIWYSTQRLERCGTCEETNVANLPVKSYSDCNPYFCLSSCVRKPGKDSTKAPSLDKRELTLRT